MTATFDTDLQRIIVTNNAPFTLTFPDLESARRMGFDALVISDTANVITANRPPDLQRYKYLFINIRELGLNNVSTVGSISFTYKVPVISNRGEYINYQESSYFDQSNIKLDPNSTAIYKLSNIEVVLTGDDGIPIDEGQINDWAFSLRLN
jgi:hypothetical protein